MDLIQNGIKTDITSWVIDNTNLQISNIDKNGISYFNLIINQNLWNILKTLLFIIIGIGFLLRFKNNKLVPNHSV